MNLYFVVNMQYQDAGTRQLQKLKRLSVKLSEPNLMLYSFVTLKFELVNMNLPNYCLP